MKQINKLLTFFSKSEKKKLLILYLMMSLSALFELIGFSLIVPIITLGLKQDLSNIPIFFNLINFININNDNMLTFFILVFVSVQILKVAFMIWYLWFENKYIYSFQEKLSSKLCKKYLFNEYKKILKESSSKILRNITYSVNLVTVYLFHFLKISLDGILLIFITFFLFTFNFKITLFIVILILLICTVI